MEMIEFLLDQGADINAAPALVGGLTALQGAAISGDLVLAQLLLEKGADVNAARSFKDGRMAIEGAAEHGRLDMVQLLLNAGANGNTWLGTGFADAISLAKGNEHFAIATLLEEEQRKLDEQKRKSKEVNMTEDQSNGWPPSASQDPVRTVVDLTEPAVIDLTEPAVAWLSAEI